MRKELKLLDSIPMTVTKLDENSEFRNGFTDGASWRNKSEYRKRHKRLIKKSLRSALKANLDEKLRNPELQEDILLDEFQSYYNNLSIDDNS